MKVSNFIGGTLIVAGTTIGVGMLGLPVTTAFMGFVPSILLFAICWLFMLATAIFFVDVNCSMKGKVNLVTMAGRTLGPAGTAISWVFYLILLYALVAAYIAASAPLFIQAFAAIEIEIPLSIAKFLLPLLFGGFIYLGTRGVDLINRVLMVGLILSYILLILFVPTHVQEELLSYIDWRPFVYASPFVLTAFGYHIVIPSLTTYLSHDRKALVGIVVLGSFIALIVNVIWQFLVLGSVPVTGANGLAAAWVKGTSAIEPLAAIVKSPLVATGAYLFAFFAIVTSFLGVGLSLADFLTDGLKIKKGWEGRLLAILLTFVPPMIFVFSYERGFLIALEYAGTCVAILLIFLPAAMAWTLKTPKFYRTTHGRGLLIASMAFALYIIIVNILINWGIFDSMFRQIASS